MEIVGRTLGNVSLHFVQGQQTLPDTQYNGQHGGQDNGKIGDDHGGQNAGAGLFAFFGRLHDDNQKILRLDGNPMAGNSDACVAVHTVREFDLIIFWRAKLR